MLYSLTSQSLVFNSGLFCHRFFEPIACHIIDGTVRSERVVVGSPNVNLFLRIFKRKKPMNGKAFISVLPIERFDIRIVRWFTGLGKVQRHLVLIGSFIKFFGNELPLSTWMRCGSTRPSDLILFITSTTSDPWMDCIAWIAKAFMTKIIHYS